MTGTGSRPSSLSADEARQLAAALLNAAAHADVILKRATSKRKTKI
jgi:hypothetical protein